MIVSRATTSLLRQAHPRQYCPSYLTYYSLPPAERITLDLDLDIVSVQTYIMVALGVCSTPRRSFANAHSLRGELLDISLACGRDNEFSTARPALTKENTYLIADELTDFSALHKDTK